VAFVIELPVFEMYIPRFLHSLRGIPLFILFAVAYKNLQCFVAVNATMLNAVG
jgi:hypothetical protein